MRSVRDTPRTRLSVICVLAGLAGLALIFASPTAMAGHSVSASEESAPDFLAKGETGTWTVSWDATSCEYIKLSWWSTEGRHAEDSFWRHSDQIYDCTGTHSFSWSFDHEGNNHYVAVNVFAYDGDCPYGQSCHWESDYVRMYATVAPHASPVDGDSELSPGETGSWTVHGHDEDCNIRYVTWYADGDWVDATGYAPTRCDVDNTLDASFSSEGTHTVTAVVESDTPEGGKTDSVTWAVDVDNKPPEVTPRSPSDPVSLDQGDSQTFEAYVDDQGENDVSHAEWYVDGTREDRDDSIPGSGGTTRFSHTFSDDGRYTVTVVGYDTRGESDSTSWTVNVDNQAPSVTLDVTPAKAQPGDKFEARIQGDDPDGSDANLLCQVDWDDGSGWRSCSLDGNGEGTATNTYTDPGNYQVRTKVRDEDGAWSSPASETITVDAAPQARLEVQPGSGTTETTFEFDASGSSDPPNSLASLDFRWDWTNDGLWDTGWQADPKETHRYDIPGEKEAKVQVRDKSGFTDTATETVEVGPPSANHPPTAKFHYDVTGVYVTGYGSQSDPNDEYDEIVEYRWSWGDGSESTGETAVHPYTTCRFTFEVTLTVTDARGGTDSLSRTIQVDAGTDKDGDGLEGCLEARQGTRDVNENTQDSDEDGLSDYLESRWYPDSHRVDLFCPDGTSEPDKEECDLPNATQPNIYVEIDWMEVPERDCEPWQLFCNPRDGYSTKPSPEILDRIERRFEDKDVSLTFDTGELGGGNRVEYREEVIWDNRSGAWDFWDIKNANFGMATRYHVYHYLLSGDRIKNEDPFTWLLGTLAGKANAGDDDLVVAYGAIREEAEDHNLPHEPYVEMSITHELGHNLCLTPVPAPDDVYPHQASSCVYWGIDNDESAPTYDSVMSYDGIAFDYSSQGPSGANPDCPDSHDEWDAIIRSIGDFTQSPLEDNMKVDLSKRQCH